MSTPSVAIIKTTVAAAATPGALGVAAQTFRSVLFYGGDVGGDANTATAYVQLQEMDADGDLGDWVDAFPVPVGEYSPAIYSEMNGSRIFNAAQFKIRVGVNGETVSAIVTR